MGALGQLDSRPGKSTLTDAGLALQHNSKGVKRSPSGERPTLRKVGHLFASPDEWPEREVGHIALADDAEMRNQTVDALHRFRQPSLEFEAGADQGFNRVGHHDGAWISEAAHPGGEICREPEDVVLCEV